MAAPPIVQAYTISTGTPIQNVPPNMATQGETMVPYPALLQAGKLTFVAGVAVVGFGGDLAPVTVTLYSQFWLGAVVPGAGVMGTKYKIGPIVYGAPDPSTGVPTGSFTVTSIDTAGATVATDDSQAHYFILG